MMTKIEIPQLENISLFEFLRKSNLDGVDICDTDWDWGIYLGCENSWDECRDYYERCMLLFCINIICTKLQTNYYSPCKVAEFITDNLAAFKKFFNDENREGYRPMDYENADDRETDDGFFEAYMQGMEGLIAGNYCEADYKKLFNMLTTKEQRDKIIKK